MDIRQIEKIKSKIRKNGEASNRCNTKHCPKQFKAVRKVAIERIKYEINRAMSNKSLSPAEVKSRLKAIVTAHLTSPQSRALIACSLAHCYNEQLTNFKNLSDALIMSCSINHKGASCKAGEAIKAKLDSGTKLTDKDFINLMKQAATTPFS